MTPDDSRLARYLLGELTPEEQDALEREFFSDDETFDLLEAVEDDLLDDYVAGALEPRRAERLRVALRTSAAGPERLAFARALRRAVARAEAAEAARTAAGRPWLWPSLAAGLAAALFGSFLLLGTARRALRESEKVRETLSREADQHTARLARLSEQLAQVRQAATSIHSVVLGPGLERSSGKAQTIMLDERTRWLQLGLLLPREARSPRYRVTLETPDGQVLAAVQSLNDRQTPSGRVVEVIYPAEALRPGTNV